MNYWAINVSFLLRLLAYVTTIPENYGIQSLIFDSVYINRVYHYLMIYNLSGFVFSDSLADLNRVRETFSVNSL